MIRVLRIIARLNVGGPAIHATLLTTRLDPGRFATTLVAGHESPEEGSYLDVRGVTLPGLVRLPALGREIQGGQDVVALRALMRLIREQRPHIVHTHTAKAGTLGRVAARLCRVPVVVHTFHGHVLQGYFSPIKTRVFTGIERLLARATDRLIAVSPKVREDLLALGIGRPERFDVVPLGLELDRYLAVEGPDGGLRHELGLAAETPLVGIVARLVPIKAHEVFLDAAVRLVGRRPDAQFVIVGDGERRAELERQATASGLGGRVHFLGWRGDLDRIYADLDVVALTSRNEGSPVALIEAMAAGRAVVSTNVGGVADVVSDGLTGRLVGDGDAEALGEVMHELIGDAVQRRRLGDAARCHAAQRYGAARLVADIDALYTRLLEARLREGV